MSEPQIWTLIGVFTAALIGLYTMVSTMFLRVLHTEISSVGTRIDSLSTEMNTRIDGLHAEMNTRFGAMERTVEGLDRDVRMLIERLT